MTDNLHMYELALSLVQAKGVLSIAGVDRKQMRGHDGWIDITGAD